MATSRVAIIGAGPVGLEAARLLTAEGHRVTVYEATGEVGGGMAACGCAYEIMRWTDVAKAQGVDLNIKLVDKAALDRSGMDMTQQWKVRNGALNNFIRVSRPRPPAPQPPLRVGDAPGFELPEPAMPATCQLSSIEQAGSRRSRNTRAGSTPPSVSIMTPFSAQSACRHPDP